MHAYRSNSLRSATLIERWPEPTGVVVGPFSAMPRSRIDSSVRSGSGLPSSSKTSMPAGCSSHSNSTPVASSTRRVASAISGPVPSPGMSVTRCAMRPGVLSSTGVDWGLGRYERTADQLLPAAEAVVASAAPAEGERVVDVGCGTGNAALLAAGGGARGMGVAPAARLLEVARALAAARGLAATFVEGESASIPLAYGE